MKEVFVRYVFTLLHPFRVHSHLRLERVGRGILPFGGEKTALYRGVNYYEAMVLSWLLFVCHCFYSLAVLHLGIYSRRFLEEQGGMFVSEEWRQGLFLVKLVATVTFFPLAAWLWVKFWDVVIRFFAELFNVEERDVERASEEITRNSLVGHTFLLIPVFGGLAQSIAGMVLLYAGLRKNLSFSRLQSLIVLGSPLFLALGLFFVYLLFLFNIFF